MKLKSWSQYLSVLSISIFVALIIRWSLFSGYRIFSESMSPTLIPGDFVFVSKAAYGLKLVPNSLPFFQSSPKRDDIVLLMPTDESDTLYIKRVVGLPGETIEIKNGLIWINGQTLNMNSDYQLNTELNLSSTLIPEDHVFVLSDNKNSSEDSKLWGAISLRHIIGRVDFIWLSLNGTKSNGFDFRFERIFKRLRD